MKMLKQHGTTDGCPQCEHIRALSEHKAGVQHTEKCRKRIAESLAATADGADRIARSELRINRGIEAASRLDPPRGGGVETVADQAPHPRDAGIDRARSDAYARAAMDRWSTRTEPLQPGCSGTDGKTGVPFTTPGPVPAADLPTQEGARRQAAGKSQGPSGLIEMSSDTAAASRQNAEELTADDDMAFIGTIG